MGGVAALPLTGDQPRRIPLPVLLVPFAVAATAGMIADWTWPKLVTEHPLALIALSSKNRFLLLSAPRLGVVAFFVVGFLRLVVTDPLTYLLGRQYGAGAITWIDQKTGTGGPGRDGVMAKAERLFGKAAPLFIVVAPSAIWCMLAGAARMKAWVFVTCNAVGTVGRLALFWVAADLFRQPLENVLDGVERFQVPLIALTVGIGVVQTIRSRRRSRAAAATETAAFELAGEPELAVEPE